LYHYIFAFEQLGRDAQSETLEQNGGVAMDVGTDPEDLCAKAYGNGPNVGEFTKDGDGRELPSLDDAVANSTAVVCIA
jgi:hypothetical protein